MSTPLSQKSTLENIRARFDKDVERFSNLDTGQAATIDAPLAMELITQAAVASTSPIKRVLDIGGCGAGNNTIKLRETLGHDFNVDLLESIKFKTLMSDQSTWLNRARRIYSDIRAIMH